MKTLSGVLLEGIFARLCIENNVSKEDCRYEVVDGNEADGKVEIQMLDRRDNHTFTIQVKGDIADKAAFHAIVVSMSPWSKQK